MLPRFIHVERQSLTPYHFQVGCASVRAFVSDSQVFRRSQVGHRPVPMVGLLSLLVDMWEAIAGCHSFPCPHGISERE